MSKKYSNNIGYDKRDHGPHFTDGSTEKDEITYTKRAYNTNIDNLVMDIFDIIKDCQTEMSVSLFDEKDFGYFYIREYLKTLDIQ